MMLVPYPDSSSENEDDRAAISRQTRKRKAEHVPSVTTVRKPLPPLPSSFYSLYATAARTSTSDDPSLHAGRSRQTPHVEGNWPTHIYLEWYPSATEVPILDDIIQQSQFTTDPGNHSSDSSIHTFLRSDLGILLPLHISLSAPLVLRTEQKTPFQESIETQLSRAEVKFFSINIIGLDWVSNHDETRFFLVLRLSRSPNDELNRLLNICNHSAQQFGLSQLYDVPSNTPRQTESQVKDHCIPDRTNAFHISIAWTLRKPTKDDGNRLAQLAIDRCRAMEVNFEIIKVKIGNAVIDIPLAKHDDL